MKKRHGEDWRVHTQSQTPRTLDNRRLERRKRSRLSRLSRVLGWVALLVFIGLVGLLIVLFIQEYYR